MTTLTRAVSAELIKLRTTRAPLITVAITVVLGVVGAFFLAPFSDSPTMVFTAFTTLAPVVFLVVSTLAVTTEYRYGTMRTSFLAVSNRPLVFCAKAIVYCGLIWLASIITLLLAYLVMLIIPVRSNSELDDAELFADDRLATPLLLTPVFLLFCVFAAIGVGALVRHTAAALPLLLIWYAVLESVIPLIGSQISDSVGRVLNGLMPFQNGLRMLRIGDPAEYMWNDTAGFIYFIVVMLAVFAGGVAVATRRDA